MRRMFLAAFALCFSVAAPVSAAEFSADITTSMAGINSPGKIFFKGTQLHRQEIGGMVIITKHSKAYQLFQATKRYVVTDLDSLKKRNPLAEVHSYEEFFQKNHMKKVGEETLQGFKCLVYKGNAALVDDRPPTSMTLWYATKLNYPIKSRISLSSPMGEVITTLKNIKIGSQPESLFHIPRGYTEAKSIQEAMGMGPMMMPTGNNPGKMPSQEEINRMRKQAQEMMKRYQDN